MPFPALLNAEVAQHLGLSTRAALVYLHSTSDRQRTIADAVGVAAGTDQEITTSAV